MRNIFIVGAGGFLGSIARYALSGVATQLSGVARFPVGTLVVNVAGCLIIGILAGVSVHVRPWSGSARLFLFTGLLGGFTTFSAFGFETFSLAREHALGYAALNVVAQLLFGLAAVWLGFQTTLLFAK